MKQTKQLCELWRIVEIQQEVNCQQQQKSILEISSITDANAVSNDEHSVDVFIRIQQD